MGLLFALLITAIGTLVVLYASRYLEGHPQAGRFYASLFAFMGAMLGVALSDNILTLFVFWELTGFTSFLLIGFEHERDDARSAALQALIVTGAGGLALLAAGVLLLDVSGTTSLSAMAASRASIVGASVLRRDRDVGAARRIYEVRPGAVSFLAAERDGGADAGQRLSALGDDGQGRRVSRREDDADPRRDHACGRRPSPAVGAATMVVGAYRSVQETDLKRILAYSTVSALGVLTMLLGVGTREAIAAALVYLVAHACYKGALFLVAGAIDHETGTRDITVLAGLRRAMPMTAVAGGAAALSMAGVPLTLGFVGKDGAYEALLHGGAWSAWLLILTVVREHPPRTGRTPRRRAAVSRRDNAVREAHEPAWPLWLPPLTLGG